MMLAFVLATVLVTASGAEPAQVQDSGQNTPTKTESAAGTISEIGTVVELKGRALAKTKTGASRELAEGDAVYAGEKLETSEDSTMQIELNDESLFTLSQNTQMSVDDFAYVSNSSEVNLMASVVKGVFRYVSGKVEKANPEKVNIEIPSGTIGIRGTIVVGEIDGENCLVALEPEEGDTPHRIIIFNDAGGKRNEIEITKPGFATRIEGRNLPPKPIFELPQDARKKFEQKLPQPPKFPQGTKPGTPERYQHLFDPGKMMERRQNEKIRRNPKNSRKPTEDKEQPFKEQDKDERRKLEDETNRKMGPKPPEGPDGNGGFENRIQNDLSGQQRLYPKNIHENRRQELGSQQTKFYRAKEPQNQKPPFGAPLDRSRFGQDSGNQGQSPIVNNRPKNTDRPQPPPKRN